MSLLLPLKLFLLLLSVHAIGATECNFTRSPSMDKLLTCLDNITQAADDVNVRCKASKADRCLIDLSGLTEDQGNAFLSKVKRWTAIGIKLTATNWTKFDLRAEMLKPNIKNASFTLFIKGNRNLTSIGLNDKALASVVVQILDSPRLSQKMLDAFSKIRGKKGSIIPRPGTCLEEKESIDNIDEIEPVCNWLSGPLHITGEHPRSPERKFRLDEGACLNVAGTKLKSLAFLTFHQSPIYRDCSADVGIAENPELCLSEMEKKQLTVMYARFPSFRIKNNDDACTHKCSSVDFLDGKVADPTKCYILEGTLEIVGNTAASVDFSNVHEIREGGLIIRDTDINYWQKFSSLLAIDRGTAAGPILQMTNVSLPAPEAFSRLRLGRLLPWNTTEEVIIKNNQNFFVDEKDLRKICRCQANVQNPPTPTPPTSKNSPKPSTSPRSSTISPPAKPSKRPAKLIQYAIIGGSVVLAVLLLAAAAVFFLRRSRRINIQLPTNVPHNPLNKPGELGKLAREILIKNPIEWKEFAQRETLSVAPLKEREARLGLLRQNYEKFLTLVSGREPVSFRLEPTIDYDDMYRTFRRLFAENPRGECQLVLISQDEDPAKVIPLFSDDVGLPIVYKTGEGSTSTISSFAKDSKRIAPLVNVEITATLKAKKVHSPRVVLCRYEVVMVEGKKTMKLSVHLAHYHKWLENLEDWKTVLLLLEHCRRKKGGERPLIVTANPSQSYVMMMLFAVVVHVVEKDFPSMELADIRQIISTKVDCHYPEDMAILFGYIVVLRWAEDEAEIGPSQADEFKDFVLIANKMDEFLRRDPNNFYVTINDLGLPADVLERRLAVRESKAESNIAEPEVLAYDPTISVSDFRKQSNSDQWNSQQKTG